MWGCPYQFNPQKLSSMVELHKLEVLFNSVPVLSIQWRPLLSECAPSLLKPNLADKVENKQLQQKVDHGHAARLRSFKEDETVYLRNLGPGQKWLPGTIVATTGPSVLSCLNCWRMVVSGGDTRLGPHETEVGEANIWSRQILLSLLCSWFPN